MIDKEKLIRDLEERQDKIMKEDTYFALGEFQAYANILESINEGKYELGYHDVAKFYME